MKKLQQIAFFTLLTLSTLDAVAQDCSQIPGNDVINCGFDNDVSSWNDLFGTGTHEPVDGYLAPGSASLVGGVTGNGHEINFQQCVSGVNSNATYTIRGALRGGDPLPDSCQLFVATRSDPGCAGGGTFVRHRIEPVTSDWVEFDELELITGADTEAVSFQFRCVRAAGNFNAFVDDAYFGIPPIHEDGFEDLPK